MKPYNYNQGLPGNPIVQVVGVLFAVIIAVAAVFVGTVVLSLFVGFAIISCLVVMVLVWWLRRLRRTVDSQIRQ